MREFLFRLVTPTEDKHGWTLAYDGVMLIIIVASIIPLAFKDEYILFMWVDRVALYMFSLDYLIRLATADKLFPRRGRLAFAIYPFTPMAIVDLLAILPSVTALHSGFRLLKILRLVRMLRVIRVFKLFRYSKSVVRIGNVLEKQRAPLFAVGTLAIGYVLISSLIVFNVEPESFDTFFDAVYWATISLTTVGYGDLYPITVAGRIVTMISSFLGIAIVALPAGIITAGYMKEIEGEE